MNMFHNLRYLRRWIPFSGFYSVNHERIITKYIYVVATKSISTENIDYLRDNVKLEKKEHMDGKITKNLLK